MVVTNSIRPYLSTLRANGIDLFLDFLKRHRRHVFTRQPVGCIEQLICGFTAYCIAQ